MYEADGDEFVMRSKNSQLLMLVVTVVALCVFDSHKLVGPFINNIARRWLVRGIIQSQPTYLEQAIDLFETSASQESRVGQLAAAYFLRHQREKGLKILQETEASEEEFVYLLGLGDYLLNRQRTEEAEALYQAVSQVMPKWGPALYRQGKLYQQQGKWQAAVEAFQAAEQQAETFKGVHLEALPDVFYQAGESLAKLRHWDEAIASYEQAVLLAPDNPQFYIGLGWAWYWGYKDVDRAIEQFQQVSLLNPRNVGGYLHISDVYRLSGDYQQALIWIEKALLQDPQNEWIYIYRGHIFFLQGNYQEAEQDFLYALSLAPQTAGAHFWLGKVYWEQEWFDDSIVQFTMAVNYKPGNVLYHLELGKAYHQTGHLEQAMDEFAAVLRLDADNKEAQRLITEIKSQLEESGRQ